MGFEIVGRSLPRVDAHDKVTGKARYGVDVSLDGMLHGRVVRSQRGHARIVGIDATSAREQPGVVAVMTSADLSGLFPRFGHIVADHPVLAIDRVRYWGEPVALVVASSRAAAWDAADHVRVHYDDLPVVLTPSDALAPDAPPLHDRRYERAGSVLAEVVDAAAGTNIAHEVRLGWGDVAPALETAELVVTTEVDFPMLYAYAMEPYNATASRRDGRLEVYSSTQHPFMVREDLARIFRLPLSAVRVASAFIGGGYGSKSYTKVEPLAAVASWFSGRPVKVVLDVEESIYTTRADNGRVRVRTGFTADGRILARNVDITLNTGAYADNGPLVLAKAANRCFGPYRIPNLSVWGRTVYTNTSPSSSYRGFGAPQGVLAGELNLDQAAQRLDIDPAELRRRNLLRRGEELLPGKRPLDADLPADLDLLLASLSAGHREEDERPRGMGFGCSASDAGAMPVSTALVRILADGSIVVATGSTEMGQGSRTVLTQIAAEDLGIPPDQIQVVQGDTDATPYEWTTGASRTTTLTGMAVQRACADARKRLASMLADNLGCEAAALREEPGGFIDADGQRHEFGEIVTGWFGARAGEVVGHGRVRPKGDHSLLPPFWEIGMVGVELAVDPDTGVVEVEQLVTVGDVGLALNPAAVEGQDLGAATQGLGAALHEELIYDGPQLSNANIVDYRVPRTADLPRRIDTVLAERRDGIGPFGAKGAGEGALNPIGAAVAAAVAQVTGKYPGELPLTPERVWRLLRNGGSHE